MDLGEILNDSFKYPLIDYKNWIILGVVILISSLNLVLAEFGLANDAVDMIFGIVRFILMLVVLGYGICILKTSIDLKDELPSLSIADNLVDGLKVFVIAIVYNIIPVIILLIVAYLSGVFSSTLEIASYYMTNSSLAVDAIPDALIQSFFGSILITLVVAVILFIIFGFLQTMALCRLAKYDNLSSALKMLEAAKDIKRIGILKFIGFEIVVWIISIIIGCLVAIIIAIPYIGVIIGLLIGYSYILIFNYRALGLLYSDI